MEHDEPDRSRFHVRTHSQHGFNICPGLRVDEDDVDEPVAQRVRGRSTSSCSGPPKRLIQSEGVHHVVSRVATARFGVLLE